MDRHISRENKTDLMNQLLSPSKKIKLENSFKQEPNTLVNNPTLISGVAVGNNVSNYSMVGGSSSSSLWGGFPTMYTTQQPSYSPVYPGMVPQYLPQNMSELQTVMKIGECSIKPLQQ